MASHIIITDDTQLLVTMNVTDAEPALERLANCSTAVRLFVNFVIN